MRIVIGILGLLLVVLAFVGNLFFFQYSGSDITHPTLKHLSCILVGLTGFGLIIAAAWKREKNEEQEREDAIANLKANAEKIVLVFDLCECNSGSYTYEVQDKTSPKAFAAGLMAGVAIDTTVTEEVNQSYLIYTRVTDAGIEKYISQAFPFDETALEFYVLNHNISLYIDRADRGKFLFELVR